MLYRLGHKILFWIIIIFGLFGSIFLYWQWRQYRKAGVSQLLQQSRGIYHYVVLSRQLISSWHGIYIKKGEEFVRITPSAFTWELASFSGRKAPVNLKIAVLNSKDPHHVPDEFERHAILGMISGKITERWTLENRNGFYRFRYAGPLVFKDECKSCHSKNPRAKILGCISIGVNANNFFSVLERDVIHFVIYMVGGILIILTLLWFMLRSYVLKPLMELSSAAEEVRRGNFHVRVHLDKSLEWQSVGENFNNMVETLAKRQTALREEADSAIEQLKVAYEELKRTEKYKSDFFTNITHDLKTPITAIKGAITILARKCSDEHDPYLDILQRNVGKLSSMVQDLLDCSRLESGELALHQEEHDLVEVLEDAVLSAMPLAWKKKIQLDYQVPEESCLAKIDRKRMEQVIINLLSNAIKFSPEEDVIEIKLAKDGDFWRVTIEDNGPGIPVDDRERIFNKFFQRSDTRTDTGMGLGLAIAKGIIEAHGGKIGVCDRLAGRHGSCFYFLIPCLKADKKD